MRGLCCVLALFTSLLASCSFPPPADVPGDGDVIPDAGTDGPPPDTNTSHAELVAEETTHDFDDVVVGQQSALLSLVIRNAGDAPSSELDVTVAGADAGDFTLVAIGDGVDCDGRTLDMNQTCLVQLRFAPGGAGAREGTLRVTAAEGGTASVALSGTGLSPGNLQITVGDALSFGTVAIQNSTAAQTITVRNSGQAATASLTASLGDAANYTKVSDTCSGAPLGAGATCDVQVRFNPSTVGSLPTQVSIRESETVGVSASAAGTGSATITVTGGAGGTITSDPAGINCGSTCSATFTQSPVTLTATVPSGYAFDGWTGACASEGTNGTCAVDLTVPTTTAGAMFRQWSCTPNTIVCDDATEHYVDCTADGRIEFEMDCPLDCASGVEKCLDVDPSNDTATHDLRNYLDMAKDSIDVSLSLNSTIDVSTGNVTDGGPGGALTVPSTIVNGIRVFWMRSFSMTGTTRVVATTSEHPPVMLLVDGNVSIGGLLDISADGVTAIGPGYASVTSCKGGSTQANPAPGGGGGGSGTNGASGGQAATTAGGIYGSLLEPTIVPLQGGCIGGTSKTSSNLFPRGVGGYGGGAIQIVSRSQITVSGTIDASGGGGTEGTGMLGSGDSSGGGGGGSGGAVLLEAPQVFATSTSTISTKGGGGGGMGSDSIAGGNGQDGGTDAAAATGGVNGTLPKGGSGGTGAALPTAGQTATGSNHGGGGGGAVGRLRVNNSNGLFSPQPGAAIRSTSSTGTIGKRQVP